MVRFISKEGKKRSESTEHKPGSGGSGGKSREQGVSGRSGGGGDERDGKGGRKKSRRKGRGGRGPSAGNKGPGGSSGQKKQPQGGTKPRGGGVPNAPAPPPPVKSGEKQRDFANEIVVLLAGKGYEPLDRKQVANELGVRGGQCRKVYEAIEQLEKEGEIARIRHDRYVIPKVADLFSGVIHLHPKGFGHVINEREGGADLFVPPPNTGTAMHGDRVLARVLPADKRGRRRGAGREERQEGKVIRILERANDKIVGTLQATKKFHYVVADDPRFTQNVYVEPQVAGGGPTATVGDKVVVRMFEWPTRHVNPEGEIVEVLGRAGSPGVDMLSILRKYDLPTDFPAGVLEEAARVPGNVLRDDLMEREDWRDRFVFTIDPDDAKDFDDAIHVEAHDAGWTLAVHIADVSHYVPPGSALDKEALGRGNSVYLPDRVVPMLPENLSNGICSLVPDEDRLTRLAVVEFDREGLILHARFARAVIRSAKRLSYEEAFAMLDSPPKDDLARRLHGAWELASLLRKNRFRDGALDLDFPEVKVIVDENGRPVELKKVENDISHQLIEEFMLAANEAVARTFRDRKLPAIYRVHESPDPQRLEEFGEMVESYDIRAGDLNHRRNVQDLLERVRGTPEEYAIKLGLLKSLQKARYHTDPLGHYGLSKANYCHFTSPIRRYADLVVHRAMNTMLDNPAPRPKGKAAEKLSAQGLKETSEHISATERNAQAAEREAVKMKKLEYFDEQTRSKRQEAFEAVVVDVRPNGLLVELPGYVVTGLVPVSTMRDDFYIFDSAAMRLRGRANGKTYTLGNRIEVSVESVDHFKQQIDFRLAGNKGGK